MNSKRNDPLLCSSTDAGSYGVKMNPLINDARLSEMDPIPTDDQIVNISKFNFDRNEPAEQLELTFTEEEFTPFLNFVTELPENNTFVKKEPNEKNHVLPSPDGVSRLPLEWITQDTDLTIITSKPKNPDYKVQENVIATKRSRPVNFKLTRVKPGVQVSITLTYQGHIYRGTPVNRCKKHDECEWCNEHQFNQGFCVISKYHTYYLDPEGHATATLTPSFEDLDDAGNAQFSVVFTCWNSCDLHVRYEKEMVLHINILQDGYVKKLEYSIQCCQNLLRDAFKDKKRKMPSDSENSPKKRRKSTRQKDHNIEDGEQSGIVSSSGQCGCSTRLQCYKVFMDDYLYPVIKAAVESKGGRVEQWMDEPPPAPVYNGN